MFFKDIKIRTKATGIVSIVVVALILVIVITSYRLVTSRFEKLEKSNAIVSVKRAINRINNTLQEIESSTRDYAPWDETYQFMHDGNRSFIEGNMPNETFINLNLNFMLFYDEKGQLGYQKFFDLVDRQEIVEDSDVTSMVTGTSQLLFHGTQDFHKNLAGLLVSPSGKSFFVAAAPIVTSKFEGPVRGTLIMGRFLDEMEIKKICSDTELLVKIHWYQDMKTLLPVKEIHEKNLLSSGPYAQAVSPQTVVGYAVLPDILGNQAVTIEVVQDRAIFQDGLALWQQHAVSVAILGGLFIGMLISLLNWLVLQRLTRVTKEVDRIAEVNSRDLRINMEGKDEIGHLAGRINCMLDSLEQHQSIQRENELYLRALLDSINCGVMVVNDQDEVIVDINKAGAAMLNRPVDKILNEIYSQFFSSPEKHKANVLDYQETVDLGERLMLRADGSKLPVLESITRVVRGGKHYLIESFIDISGLKKTQEELEASEEKYRQFFEEDLACNSISTLDGGIIDCNPAFARMLGYRTVAAVKQANFFDHYFTRQDREEILEIVRREKQLVRHEWKLRHLNGTPIYCIGNVIGIFDKQGELTACRGFIFDDTKRVILEKATRRHQKLEAIGILAGGISHDFNNILAGMIGYTEIVKRDLIDIATPRINQYLTNILVGGERASALIKQILTFSSSSELAQRPVNLQQVVEEIILLVRASLPSTINIKQRFNSQATVMANQAQLHQVLMNLCTNAGHAMKDGGTLTLKLEDVILNRIFTDRYRHLVPGEYVWIQVSDTGQGIPELLQDRIFDPFFTTKKKGEGTGLGLFMVHGIINTMKGLITVDSAVGKGASFDIYLPKIIGDREDVSRNEFDILPTGSEHIVFVDDDPFLVEIGKEILCGLGYRVTSFVKSPDALYYLSEHHAKVDLVITDMTMPEITGLDLARSLQAKRIHLPVILCTGHSEGLSTERLVGMDICDLLLKPITMYDLASKVRIAMDQSGHEE